MKYKAIAKVTVTLFAVQTLGHSINRVKDYTENSHHPSVSPAAECVTYGSTGKTPYRYSNYHTETVEVKDQGHSWDSAPPFST